MSIIRLALGVFLLHAAASAGHAALFRRSPSGSQRAPAITLRKRVHVNTLITEPDTIQVQWGGAFSWDGRTLATASTDGVVRIWYSATEAEVRAQSSVDDNASHQ